MSLVSWTRTYLKLKLLRGGQGREDARVRSPVFLSFYCGCHLVTPNKCLPLSLDQLFLVYNSATSRMQICDREEEAPKRKIWDTSIRKVH